ncbi:MAG: SPW repeat protein [Bdellovibrionaceae bacterium]|nr:SPW repeat protein [Pseudobdellovibrionaceae bacterium]NUM59829.1 SPW repeat protein [Pseudobdellovibrionaceae bacterium]
MNKATWENWTNLIIGVWFFVTPWFVMNSLTPELASIANWNFWIVGLVIAISAGLALQDLKPWEEWVNLILGVWMMLSPWALGFSIDKNLLMNSVIAGAVVVVFSGISIPTAQRIQRHHL